MPHFHSQIHGHCAIPLPSLSLASTTLASCSESASDQSCSNFMTATISLPQSGRNLYARPSRCARGPDSSLPQATSQQALGHTKKIYAKPESSKPFSSSPIDNLALIFSLFLSSGCLSTAHREHSIKMTRKISISRKSDIIPEPPYFQINTSIAVPVSLGNHQAQGILFDSLFLGLRPGGKTSHDAS